MSAFALKALVDHALPGDADVTAGYMKMTVARLRGVASGVWAKRHQQITPRCSRSQDPEDAIEDTSVVHPRNATWLVRQHRPYGSPFIVGEFVAHDSSPQSGSLNHRGLTHRKELLARPWFGVFGAGADINLPTILNETDENDPKQR